MTQQPQIHFFERLYPSANMILIRGEHPVLVDTGFGGDLARTEALLRQAGQAPEGLALIVNTHYHIDHAGGNSGLQQCYNIPIAAHRWDAQLINHGLLIALTPFNPPPPQWVPRYSRPRTWPLSNT